MMDRLRDCARAAGAQIDDALEALVAPVRGRGLGRMWPGLLLTALLAWVVWQVAPLLVGAMVNKMLMVTSGAVAGYWIDRWLFPYARPHDLCGTDFEAAQLRRAIIVAASMLSMANAF